MFEDDPPRGGVKSSSAQAFAPLNFEKMSVDELQVYLAHLLAETRRAESEISRKKAIKEAASSFFKT